MDRLQVHQVNLLLSFLVFCWRIFTGSSDIGRKKHGKKKRLGGGNSFFFNFHSENWGRFSPILTIIFFRWVGEKPPTQTRVCSWSLEKRHMNWRRFGTSMAFRKNPSYVRSGESSLNSPVFAYRGWENQPKINYESTNQPVIETQYVNVNIHRRLLGCPWYLVTGS